MILLFLACASSEPLELKPAPPEMLPESEIPSWIRDLPSLPPRELATPPGLRMTLANCPDSVVTMQQLRRVTSTLRTLCHPMTHPVALDDCYSGDPVPGYIYVDTTHPAALEGSVGIAYPLGPPTYTTGGVILMDETRVGKGEMMTTTILGHEVFHTLGYDHARSGLMAPSIDTMGRFDLAGLSVCDKR